MRDHIWRPPLSIRWRLLPFLASPLCVAAIADAGEDDDHHEANEASDEELAECSRV